MGSSSLGSYQKIPAPQKPPVSLPASLTPTTNYYNGPNPGDANYPVYAPNPESGNPGQMQLTNPQQPQNSQVSGGRSIAPIGFKDGNYHGQPNPIAPYQPTQPYKQSSSMVTGHYAPQELPVGWNYKSTPSPQAGSPTQVQNQLYDQNGTAQFGNQLGGVNLDMLLRALLGSMSFQQEQPVYPSSNNVYMGNRSSIGGYNAL